MIGVTWHKVGGIRGETDNGTIRRDRRSVARAVGLAAARSHTHPRGRTLLAVADKDIRHTVGVVGYQIARRGVVNDEPPVRRDNPKAAEGITLDAARSHNHPLGRAVLAVANEQVRKAVGRARY